jgi:DNA mismatch repair protein MutL
MPIVILDESVASRIAAGEVIERPASIVKELVENSLDAGAARISVELEQGGTGLIRVTDDGCGMSKEDLVLSLQRHATSKIRSLEDLDTLKTMGFRGEALPSIAAVTHLSLVARQRQDGQGWRAVAEGGVVTELNPVGAPPGTEVAAARLFYNTPARLKFLKSEATELSHAADVVTRFCLSHPQVSFRLTHNGREVIHKPSCSDLRGSLASLMGPSFLDQLLPISLSLPWLGVEGFVSKPESSRATRTQQYFFVNSRWVRSRILLRAAEDAYRGNIPPRRYPILVLLLEVDGKLLDVNVHPTKSEVRFAREGEVFQAVRRAISQALESSDLSVSGSLVTPATAPSRAEAAVAQPLTTSPAEGRSAAVAPSDRQPTAQMTLPSLKKAISLTALGQLKGTYILAESPEGLVVVNQHRAHERVLFEALRRQSEGRQDSSGPERQALAAAPAVGLSHREAAAIEQHLDELQHLGFEIEPFGPASFRVRAVPQLLARLDAERLFRDIAEELAISPHGDLRQLTPQERLLASVVCHSAIRAGQAMSEPEMQKLLDDLSETEKPFTCPHGSPLIMTISNFELDRKFNR